MLGNIALRGANSLDNFLNTSLLVADDTENLQTQGVGYRLERPGGHFNVFLLVDQIEGRSFQDKTSIWLNG